jgi:DNA polymerase I-like protein with 3'-5' exonuclease and polymerase domains
MKDTILAVDFETYYDKKVSITVYGARGYFSHPQFSAYLVSVVGNEGFVYVGCPKEFDWSLLNDKVLLSHNASFDETLYKFGVEKKWWGACTPKEWHCTADLAAFSGIPRNLKGASSVALGIEISKDTRDNMAGKRWEDMTPEFRTEVIEYAAKDSELALALWDKLSPGWPDQERQISRVNREALQKGIPVDQKLLKEYSESLAIRLFEAEQSIPWIGDSSPLSRSAFNEECRKKGLTPPKSLALTDEEANKWMEDNCAEHLWIAAVREWRRVNSLKKKIEAFDLATMSDGRYYGGITYFGAQQTGRFSGSGGNLNLQNLAQGEMFGVDVRKLICAPTGKKLLVADLSQIEVRTLCWLANDKQMLELIEQTDDIYHSFAIKFGIWSDDKGPIREHDPKLRHLAKTMTLGCGYGTGPAKFATMADVSMGEAQQAVERYRRSMKKIVSYWKFLDIYGKNAAMMENPLRLTLPSGRTLDYGVPFMVDGNFGRGLCCKIYKQSRKQMMRLWGGILAQNLSQALARDILSDMMLRIERKGLRILFHVHDEVVLEVDEDSAEEDKKTVDEIMMTPPEWISIPLSCESKLLTRYEK